MMGPRQVIRQLADLDRTATFDLLRAAAELLIARARLPRLTTAELIKLRADGEALPPSATIDRVSFAIPRVAARMPWRSDCLVQALAAQRWLAAYKIPTSLVLGVRKDGGTFAAHAWLKAGEHVVTGGDISRYQPVEPKEIGAWRTAPRTS